MSPVGPSDAIPAPRLRPTALAGAAGRFAHDARAAAAVEFAIVSTALILMVVFVLALGLLLYFGQALDRATAVAARQIMIGAVQKANMTQSAFRTSVVCPALPAAMNCGDVIVNVQTIAKAAQPNGYYGLVNSNQTALLIPQLSNASAQFSPGTQGSYVYLQVIYPITFLPAFMSRLFATSATYNGTPAYLTVATAAFRNEQY
jgi:Flp pilus assembly protein TadG